MLSGTCFNGIIIGAGERPMPAEVEKLLAELKKGL
jgi:hypothetical protein